MMLDQFGDLLNQRIPTPEEFVRFAQSQGWQIMANDDGTGSLRVPDRNNPLAMALARMLTREPYRTNVLRLLGYKPPPPAREWLWRFGQRYTETPDDPRFGQPDKHPVGAVWWRMVGETEWRFVPGKEDRTWPLPEGA